MRGGIAPPGPERPKITHVSVIDRGMPGKLSHAKIPQSKRRVIIAAFIVGAVVASSLQLLILQYQSDSNDQPRHARMSIAEHSPIFIYGNGQFTSDNGVRSGSGTSSDPYVISDWAINASADIGIYVSSTSAYFVIRNVTVNSTARQNDGIYFEAVSNAWIHNVTIFNCHTGIDIEASGDNIAIDSSSISYSADHGIVRQYGLASYVNISQNTIFQNGGTGIALGSTSYFNVISNTITTNDESSGGRRGITLTVCSSGVVTGNSVTAVYNEAMSCTSSHDVLVVGNSFSSDWYYDVQLISCFGFLIYGNNFLGSLLSEYVTEHGYDTNPSVNLWNASYPTGGNYWIEYTGEDNMRGPDQDQPGKDGIGDTPYHFNQSQTDYYPLNTSKPVEPIPEFPTLLLPIISVLAFLFVAIRRSPRREY